MKRYFFQLSLLKNVWSNNSEMSQFVAPENIVNDTQYKPNTDVLFMYKKHDKYVTRCLGINYIVITVIFYCFVLLCTSMYFSGEGN